jgi:hypothetical protein
MPCRFDLGLLVMMMGCATASAQDVVFSRDILPILSDNCFQCHGPDATARKAKLRLDEEAGAKAERRGRKAIDPGHPDKSGLVARVFSKDPDEMMPPPRSNKKVTAKQAELLKKWIAQGAPWGKHWAFTPPTRPAIPKIAGVVRNPIDAFLLDRLHAEGLTPTPEAPRTTLIRRATLALTGLPPTPAEVDAFLADKAPNAYERVVDRLLHSPAFGERMAWDWLDAARYADSNGYQGDGDRTMWPWRDWVVDAFNTNLPYDRFTVWQLAGDLLPEATDEQKLATGFCRNHMINGEGGRIPDENRVDYVMDMTETMGTVWLGLTLNCCRCHDHRFDPLAQKDYYRLFAFFNQTPIDGGGGNPQTPPVLEIFGDKDRARLKELNKSVAAAAKVVEPLEAKLVPDPKATEKFPELVRKALGQPAEKRSVNQWNELEKHWKSEKDAAQYLKALRSARSAVETRDGFNRALPRVMIMQDLPKNRPTFMLDRGLYNKPKDPIDAALPTLFGKLTPSEPVNRLGLAHWLTDKDHPLTARVTINRLWQQFFGVGLVKTPEDFGSQGEFPKHPQLLDWLSREFIDSGWDLQHVVRLIVTSEAFRRSSKVTPAIVERDPENRLLARGPRYRMPSWMLRDQALAASGLLVPKLGGPPVRPYQPGGVWEEATFGGKRYVTDKGDSLYRRSLYTFWRRIIGPTMFFDNAARQVCTVKSVRTNTPLQALAMFNDVTYVEASRALAERVILAEKSNDARLALAFRKVLARSPSPREREVLATSLARLTSEFREDPEAARKLLKAGESPRNESIDVVEHAAYLGVCSLIFNLDETLNLE